MKGKVKFENMAYACFKQKFNLKQEMEIPTTKVTTDSTKSNKISNICKIIEY